MKSKYPGTETYTSLSTGQQALLVCIWFAFIAAFVLFAQQHHNESGLLTLAFFIGGIVPAYLTYRVNRIANGVERRRIVHMDALRGEFSIRHAGYMMLIFAGIPLWIIGATVFFRPLRTPAEMVFALVYVALIVVPLVMFFRSVRWLRIDDDESVWIKRTSGGWQPLHVADFGRVEGGFTSVFPYRWRLMTARPDVIRFLGAAMGVRSVRIPLAWVVSREYRSRVEGKVIEDFFLEQCKKAGYTVAHMRKPYVAWVARPPMKAKREPGKPKRGEESE